jgi:type I restriction enzyme M protein
MALELIIRGNKIFAPLKGKELVLTPEERVRQEFLVHLVNTYGYSLEQMAQEVQVNNSQRGQGKARADIVIWKSLEDKQSGVSPVIVVECKAEQITIREEDYFQGYNYASWAGADFFVTTNMKDTKFFRVVKGLMPKALEEIVEIPKNDELNNEKKIQELLSKTKTFTRDEFSKLLFKCHNIIRNNDKLSPEAAFDEISKILFMKIRYEREQAKTKALFSKKEFENLNTAYQKIAGRNAKPFYQHFFDQTKEIFKDDEIFDINDTIKIRENSFLQIVQELEKYNLSDTSDDVKGIAFEEFLGKTFRGELGQFFTPRSIVDYMVDILDPQEKETICDPCCGSGGFLIKAFEYVRDKIEKDIHRAKEEIKNKYFKPDFIKLPAKKQEEITEKVNDLLNKLSYELELSNHWGRLRYLSYDCIFGTDANPRMARTAKMNMIMHGDGHGGVHHHDGLLNVNGVYDGRFDVILTNPPFGARVEKTAKVSELDIPDESKLQKYVDRYGSDYLAKVVQPLKDWAEFDNGHGKPRGKSILDLFDVGKLSGLTEVLFLERCLNLLKPGGRMGIVLPEGVLNNTALQRVREYVEGKAKIINITSIPQDVFIASGATVKPSLVFLKKFTEDEAREYEQLLNEVHEELSIKFEPVLFEIETKYKHASEKYGVDKNKLRFQSEKKDYLEAKRKIAQQIEIETKEKIKEKFDYPVPVVEVEKAGITSTGAPCENELVSVAEEFNEYRRSMNLWKSEVDEVQYPVDENGIITRIIGVSEPEVFYETK